MKLIVAFGNFEKVSDNNITYVNGEEKLFFKEQCVVVHCKGRPLCLLW